MKSYGAHASLAFMALRVVRLGGPRDPAEGLRIGTVRRPPRGVPKDQFAARDYFDLWLPELAPSASVVKWASSEPWTTKSWAEFRRRYLREMTESSAKRLLVLLAALSRQTNFSVGCYCADETRCHRSLLKELLLAHGAEAIEPDD